MLEQHQTSERILRHSTQVQSKALYDKLRANAVKRGQEMKLDGCGGNLQIYSYCRQRYKNKYKNKNKDQLQSPNHPPHHNYNQKTISKQTKDHPKANKTSNQNQHQDGNPVKKNIKSGMDISDNLSSSFQYQYEEGQEYSGQNTIMEYINIFNSQGKEVEEEEYAWQMDQHIINQPLIPTIQSSYTQNKPKPLPQNNSKPISKHQHNQPTSKHQQKYQPQHNCQQYYKYQQTTPQQSQTSTSTYPSSNKQSTQITMKSNLLKKGSKINKQFDDEDDDNNDSNDNQSEDNDDIDSQVEFSNCFVSINKVINQSIDHGRCMGYGKGDSSQRGDGSGKGDSSSKGDGSGKTNNNGRNKDRKVDCQSQYVPYFGISNAKQQRYNQSLFKQDATKDHNVVLTFQFPSQKHSYPKSSPSAYSPLIFQSFGPKNEPKTQQLSSPPNSLISSFSPPTLSKTNSNNVNLPQNPYDHLMKYLDNNLTAKSIEQYEQMIVKYWACKPDFHVNPRRHTLNFIYNLCTQIQKIRQYDKKSSKLKNKPEQQIKIKNLLEQLNENKCKQLTQMKQKYNTGYFLIEPRRMLLDVLKFIIGWYRDRKV